MMCEKSDGMMLDISQEERLRHDTLFYAQGPIEGLLPGEKARAVFLKSDLPLLVLSQIWNLVDTPRDNMLDSSEFAMAMHLIQHKLLGGHIDCTAPIRNPLPVTPEVTAVPQMTYTEFKAFRSLFDCLDVTRRGFLDASLVREVLLTSDLSADALSLVWDLCDVDRDTKLSSDEFTIACHLVSQLKTGVVIDGALNVQCLLPNRMAKHDLKIRRKKLCELENKKNRLLALRERRKEEYLKERERLRVYEYGLELLYKKYELLSALGLCDSDDNSVDEAIDYVEPYVALIQEVVNRLDKEREVIRQEIARLIMEEQRLTQEVATLEEQAENLRKRRERTSLLKDLDPFHELHELRKEERAAAAASGGAQPPSQSDTHQHHQHQPVFPHRWNPFNVSHLQSNKFPPLSGHSVFMDTDWPQHVWDSKQQQAGRAGAVVSVEELTCGFGDNLVKMWSEAGGENAASAAAVAATAAATAATNAASSAALGDPDVVPQYDPPPPPPDHPPSTDTTTSPSQSSSLATQSPPYIEWSPASVQDTTREHLLWEEQDPVFRTVPVTAEDDDIWCTLPEAVLARPEPEAEVTSLEDQLIRMRSYIQQLSQQGGQLVMRNNSEHDRVISSRRQTRPSDADNDADDVTNNNKPQHSNQQQHQVHESVNHDGVVDDHDDQQSVNHDGHTSSHSTLTHTTSTSDHACRTGSSKARRSLALQFNDNDAVSSCDNDNNRTPAAQAVVQSDDNRNNNSAVIPDLLNTFHDLHASAASSATLTSNSNTSIGTCDSEETRISKRDTTALHSDSDSAQESNSTADRPAVGGNSTVDCVCDDSNNSSVITGTATSDSGSVADSTCVSVCNKTSKVEENNNSDTTQPKYKSGLPSCTLDSKAEKAVSSVELCQTTTEADSTLEASVESRETDKQTVSQAPLNAGEVSPVQSPPPTPKPDPATPTCAAHTNTPTGAAPHTLGSDTDGDRTPVAVGVTSPVAPPRRKRSSKKQTPNKPPRRGSSCGTPGVSATPTSKSDRGDSIASGDSVLSAVSSYHSTLSTTPSSYHTDTTSSPQSSVQVTPQLSPTPTRPSRRYTPHRDSASVRSLSSRAGGARVLRSHSTHSLYEPDTASLHSTTSGGSEHNSEEPLTSEGEGVVKYRDRVINRRGVVSLYEPGGLSPVPPPRTKRRSLKHRRSLDATVLKRAESLPFEIENVGADIKREVGNVCSQTKQQSEDELSTKNVCGSIKDKDVDSDLDSGVLSIRESSIDDDMDLQSRKVELDSLRSRFFKDQKPDGDSAGSSGSSEQPSPAHHSSIAVVTPTPAPRGTGTVVAVHDEPPPSAPVVSSGVVTIGVSDDNDSYQHGAGSSTTVIDDLVDYSGTVTVVGADAAGTSYDHSFGDLIGDLNSGQSEEQKSSVEVKSVSITQVVPPEASAGGSVLQNPFSDSSSDLLYLDTGASAVNVGSTSDDDGQQKHHQQTSRVILDLDEHQFVPDFEKQENPVYKTETTVPPQPGSVGPTTIHLEPETNLLDLNSSNDTGASKDSYGTVLYLGNETPQNQQDDKVNHQGGNTTIDLFSHDFSSTAHDTTAIASTSIPAERTEPSRVILDLDDHQYVPELERNNDTAGTDTSHLMNLSLEHGNHPSPAMHGSHGSENLAGDEYVTINAAHVSINESVVPTDDLSATTWTDNTHQQHQTPPTEDHLITDIDSVLDQPAKRTILDLDEMQPATSDYMGQSSTTSPRSTDFNTASPVSRSSSYDPHSPRVDDSDVSDTDQPSFQATFSPHQTDTHLHHEDTDSGITLVSFNNTTSTDTDPSDSLLTSSIDTMIYSSSESGYTSSMNQQHHHTPRQPGEPVLLSVKDRDSRTTSPVPGGAAGDHRNNSIAASTSHGGAYSPYAPPAHNQYTQPQRVVGGGATRPDILKADLHPTTAAAVAAPPRSPTGGGAPKDVGTPTGEGPASPTKSAGEIAQERRTLIDTMKVRRKKVINWLQDDEQDLDNEEQAPYQRILASPTTPTPAGTTAYTPTSAPINAQQQQAAYHQPDVIPPDQRHVIDLPVGSHHQRYGDSPHPHLTQEEIMSTPNVKDIRKLFAGGRPLKPGEIDSRSINQPEKVKEWNEKFAGSDVTLFPKESAGSKGISVNYDLSQFHSEVESEKLDLERTKTIWEEKYAELNKQGEIERQAKSRLSQSRPPPTSSARSSVSQPPSSAGWGSGGGGGGGGNPRESAIDREIRLAQEREREMRREHTMLDGSAGKSAGKHGNYQQITAQTQHQVHHQPHQQHHQGAPPQRGGSGGLEEMTEVDQAAEMLKRSIIERDIQLQQQREHDYKQELPHRRATGHRDKEREQSEYEHREKEQERVNAHESVIERDIRLQRERDRDLNSSRSSTVTTSYSHHDITTTSSELGAAQASSGAGAVRSSPSMPAIRTASPPPANARGEGQHHETGNPNSPPQLRYEEAISTKAHAGESRIARELREQREREEELRARWHTMGVQSPMANTEPDTPYNMPEPKQKPVVGPSADRGHISKSESAHEMSAGRADGTDGKSSMSASVSIDSGLFRVHRVAPMKNADGSTIDESPEDAPHNETPIEREIRLTREREEELRREKGLPVASSAPKREVRVPVSATPSHGLHRRGDENTHRSGTIQRLASSRIHKEIESQRGREMLLRDEGKIKSVTSDDVDHHQKYVDIIPKEGHVAPPPQGSHREPKASAPPRDVLVSGPVRSKMYSAPSFSKTSAASHNANDPLDNNSNKGAVQLEANSRTVERQDTPSPQPHHTATHHTATHHQHSNGSVVANGNINHNTTTHHQQQQQQQHGGSTTRVAQQQQPQQRSSTVPLHEPAPGQHYSIRRAQNPTGSRIEQELREMKEREEELRRQHLAESGGGAGLRYGSPTPSLSVEGEGDRYDDSSSHAAAMVASANQPNDRGSSSVRRSALAAQWQKRITSTSSEQ